MGFFSKLFGDDDAVQPAAGPAGYANQSLSQQEFEGKNLAGMNFQGADLSQCTFDRANLSRADFTGAKVSQCEFKGTDLRGARFDRAEVTQSTFTEAKLDGLSTIGTEFTQCDDLPAELMSRFDDIDSDDDKFRIARMRLEQLRVLDPGGGVKERRADDELFFSGTAYGCPFRVLVNISWGNVEVEMKPDRPLGDLSVQFDPEKQPARVEADSVWDKEDAPTVVRFLGPGVFIESDAEEVARQVAILGTALPGQLAQFMRAENVEWLRVGTSELTVKFRGDVLKGDLVRRTQQSIEALQLVRTTARF